MRSFWSYFYIKGVPPQQGLPERRVLPATVPESPAFALKKRIQRESRVEEVRTFLVVLNSKLLTVFFFVPSLLQRTYWLLHPSRRHVNKLEPGGFFFCQVKQPSPIKPPPVPHFGLPFQPRLPENHHVEVCPFSFEERERERRALKEKRLEGKRNEEVRSHFKNLCP